MKTRKIISVMITLAMLMSLLPMTVSVSAEETDNKYVKRSWDGRKVTEELCDIPTATALAYDKHNWRDGWYVADGEIEISSVEVYGDVNLVLKDGCKLNITDSLNVYSGYSLTIYAQKGGTGTLTVANGIGAGSRTSSGDITIHGGNVTVTGTTSRPAIGCGNQASMGTFTLYGGNVTATGAGSAPAIGQYGTASSGAVNIYGGKLTAAADESTQAIKAASVTIGEKVEVTDGSGNLVTLNGTWVQTLTGSTYTFYAPPIVEYLYYDVIQKKFLTGECDDYTVVTSDTTVWTGGWYVVNEDVTIDGDITYLGDFNLILCDDKAFTVNGNIYSTGNGGDFAVYARSDGENMGSLNVSGLAAYGSNIVINGGNVTASTLGISSTSGNITINGGVVSVSSNTDAISAGGGITITGGKVTATSLSRICIYSTGDINITGGEVTATGGKYGIFSDVEYGSIDISGGVVSATGGDYGLYSNVEKGSIGISGGVVSATGEIYGTYSYRFSFHGGDMTAQGGEKAVSAYSVIIYNSMAVYNRANERIPAPEDQSQWSNILTDTYYRFIDSSLAVPYRYYELQYAVFKEGLCTDFKVIDENTTEWESGWYVVNGKCEISDRVTTSGNVNLILSDGCDLSMLRGINVEEKNSLSIYAQDGGTGMLYAHDSIGADNAGTIKIHGGNINASSRGGTGIGGAGNSSCVDIYGGNVNVSAGADSAGIGRNVNIHGGIITTTSQNGAGIGGNAGMGGGLIQIFGGTITATNIACGAGIGGGFGGTGGSNAGGDIYIFGGDITATGVLGAGIGGGRGDSDKNGHGGNSGRIFIFGGNITAASHEGAGIGGGYAEARGGDCEHIYIIGGNVTATSENGAGIGGGWSDTQSGGGGAFRFKGGSVTAVSENGAAIGGGGGAGAMADVTLGENALVYDSENSLVTLTEGDVWGSVMNKMKYAKIGFLAPTVPGAQIRLSGKQGLRFVGEISENAIKAFDDENNSMLDNKNFSEDYGYGFIVLPTNLTFPELYGTEEGLTLESGNIAVVPANNVYEVGSDYVRFTVCIVDILPKNYKREYTVRPYVNYTDKNGNMKTIYGDPYSTSVYAVAEAAYKSLGENTPQAILDILGK